MKLIKYYTQFIKENILKYKDISKAISTSLVYKFLTISINLGTGILICREILEANTGLYSLFITSLVTLHTLLNFGFIHSSIYHSGKYPEKLKSMLVSNLILTLIGAICISIILYFFSFYLNFQSLALRNLFIVSFIFFSFNSIYQAFLAGQNKILYAQKIELFTRFCFLIFVLILYYTKSINLIAVFSFLTLEYIFISYFTHKKLEIRIDKLEFNYQFFKESFLFNAKSYFVSVMIMLLMRSDQYIIKHFLGNYNVGVYTRGSMVVENMSIISAMISVYFIPKLLAMEDLKLALRKSKKIMMLLFGISILLASIMYFASPYVMLLFFKKQNELGTESLRILLIGFIFWSLFYLTNSIYLSLRYKKSYIFILILCFGLNVSINMIYIPTYGIKAAAWSSTICYFLLFSLSYIDLFVLKKRNFISRNNED